MNKQDDRQWSAYIDGELSISELEEFEAKLTKDELEYLKDERLFEEKIGDSLRSAPACPSDLLSNTFRQIGEKKKKSNFKIKILAAAVAAALFLFYMLPKPGTSGVNVPQTVAELQKMSKTGSSLDDINKFLTEKSIRLEVLKFKEEHHEKTIIGAGVEIVAGEEVVTLLFTCCGRPAKVYLLPKDSAAEKFIVNDSNDWKGSIQALVKKGNYRLAVSSPHDSESLLTYINHT